MKFDFKNSKLFYISLAVVIGSFALSTVVSLFSLQIIESGNRKEVSTVLAGRVNDAIVSTLSEPIIVSNTLSYDRYIIDILRDENSYSDTEFSAKVIDYLSTMKRGLNYQNFFLVSCASKKYFTADGIVKDVDPLQNSYDYWYPIFVNMNKKYDLDVDLDDLHGNVFTVYVNVRIEDDDGKLLGIIGVGVEMDTLQFIAQKFEDEYDLKINLINSNGIVQMDTDEDNIESAIIKDAPLSENQSEEPVYTKRRNGGYVITKYIKYLDWYLVVQSTTVTNMSTYRGVILVNLIVLLLVLIILFVITSVLVQHGKELLTDSYYDELTGLLNRRAYSSAIEYYTAMAGKSEFSVALVDINGLKTVNDQYGHCEGDNLISGCAKVLKDVIKDGKIYRIGGDEFVAIIDDKTDIEDLSSLKREIKNQCRNYKGSNGESLSIAIGFASSTINSENRITKLIEKADLEMYKDKTEYYRIEGLVQRK